MATSVTSIGGTDEEDSASLRWVESLIVSNNQTVAGICEETLCLMLHLNEQQPKLFELAIRMCYTKPDFVAIRCFRALAVLFSQRFVYDFYEMYLNKKSLTSINY